ELNADGGIQPADRIGVVLDIQRHRFRYQETASGLEGQPALRGPNPLMSLNENHQDRRVEVDRAQCVLLLDIDSEAAGKRLLAPRDFRQALDQSRARRWLKSPQRANGHRNLPPRCLYSGVYLVRRLMGTLRKRD